MLFGGSKSATKDFFCDFSMNVGEFEMYSGIPYFFFCLLSLYSMLTENTVRFIFVSECLRDQKEYQDRRKIRLIKDNAKCRHLQKFTCKRDFAAGVYLSEGPEPHLRPLKHCICVYGILIHTWKGGRLGRVEPERRFEGQRFTKLGRKYQLDEDIN
jgi:hypothetical protein